MQGTLVIDGRQFELLGTQRSGAAVYRGTNAYLRIGERGVISHDLAQHREMKAAKYPVARILSDGEHDSLTYFIEESLGQESFRAMFEEDYLQGGSVSGQHFSSFTRIAKKLYAAQLKAQRATWDIGEFAAGLQVTTFARELPAYRADIEAKFVSVAERLQKLPGTLLHGDCNAANMYEKGVIDLEDSFYGPVGYDQISALMSMEWSPDTRDYEFYARYKLTREQKESYIRALNSIGRKAGVVDIASPASDLAFCRALWLCRGMAAWPRIQQWRYEKFIHDYLS
jgi:hypothetical protein